MEVVLSKLDTFQTSSMFLTGAKKQCMQLQLAKTDNHRESWIDLYYLLQKMKTNTSWRLITLGIKIKASIKDIYRLEGSMSWKYQISYVLVLFLQFKFFRSGLFALQSKNGKFTLDTQHFIRISTFGSQI